MAQFDLSATDPGIRLAFHGSLKDLGIIDLIQFPHSGRKTGMLVLTGTESEALLYYLNGNLIHANMGSLQGIDVLSEVIGWTEGAFSFRLDGTTHQRTIELDLHQALMEAISVRDTREHSSAPPRTKPPFRRSVEKRIESILSAFLAAHDSVLHVAILQQDGSVLAQRSRDIGGLAGEPPLREAVAAFIQRYSHARLNRLVLDDDLWLAVFTRLTSPHYAMIVTDRQATLGVLCVAANRLTVQIERGGLLLDE